MQTIWMNCRQVLVSLITIAALPVALPAAVATAGPADTNGNSSSAADEEAKNNAPFVEPKLMQRLPDLPGRVQAVSISPDNRRLAIACKNAGGDGSKVYLLKFGPGAVYRLILDLPHARNLYSSAWEANGKRLALTVWDYESAAAKPYQTTVYVVDSNTGKQAARKVLWEERNPIDKNGTWLHIAWLGPDSLLATRERSSQVFEIDLVRDKMTPIYSLADAGAKPGASWLGPVTLGSADGALGLLQREVPKLPPAGPTNGRERVRLLQAASQKSEAKLLVFGSDGRLQSSNLVPAMAARPVEAGVDRLLVSKNAYYRSFSVAQGTPGSEWLGELVDARTDEIVARVSLVSPFAAPGFDCKFRIGRSLSLDGSRVVLHETEIKSAPQPRMRKITDISQLEEAQREYFRQLRELPGPKHNDQEPFGRLVLVDFSSFVSKR